MIATSDADDWQPARLLAPELPYAWVLFEHYWTPPAPGRYQLRCRAIDAAGNAQPEAQLADRESYVANWIVPVEVEAEAAIKEDKGLEEFVI